MGCQTLLSILLILNGMETRSARGAKPMKSGQAGAAAAWPGSQITPAGPRSKRERGRDHQITAAANALAPPPALSPPRSSTGGAAADSSPCQQQRKASAITSGHTENHSLSASDH